MNLNKKRKVKRLLTFSLYPFLVAGVIACSQSISPENIEKKDINKFDFIKMAEGKEWGEGEIVRWKDGDTPEVKYSKPGSEVKEKASIRIMFLDTPEKFSGSKPTTGLENTWANAATNFAEKLLPPGSKIRIIFTGDKSYDRLVGEIFYGKDFSKSFSVSMVENGYSLPQLSTAQKGLAYVENSVSGNLLKPLALAMEYAYRTMSGLWSLKKDNSSISFLRDVFKEHGAPIVSFSYFIYKGHRYSQPEDNVWAELDFIKELAEKKQKKEAQKVKKGDS
ncbi:thermonuclease family protein [Candidatus Mycoplasma pogonae]